MELGPYNCKSQFGITFFRPESYSKIDQLQAWLSKNSETGEIFRNSVHPPVSKIYLPKFKVEREIDLMETLKKLGVASVFDFSKADFSEMVLHKLETNQVHSFFKHNYIQNNSTLFCTKLSKNLSSKFVYNQMVWPSLLLNIKLFSRLTRAESKEVLLQR